MDAVIGLENIMSDHFKPFRVEASRNRFEFPHAIFVAVLPATIAIIIACFWSPFIAANAGPVVAIYAVIAAVLTAIMPTINGLIGPVDRDRIKELREGSTTSDANIEAAKVLVAKAEIVRSLYAAVAWSVIMLCVSLVPVLILSHSAFLADTKTPPVDIGTIFRVFRWILVVVVAFAGATSFIALLQIVSGVHLMLRHNQVDVESDLKALSERYRL